MTDVSDFIEEELGLEVLPWQRELLDKWFPPPPPYVPPKLTLRQYARRWFNRVILRRKPPPSLAAFDKVLRDVYGPGLRAALDQSSSLLEYVKQHPSLKSTWWKPWTWPFVVKDEWTGRKCVWQVHVHESDDIDG